MKMLTKKQIDALYDTIFHRMREADFERLIIRLKRNTGFKCLQTMGGDYEN